MSYVLELWESKDGWRWRFKARNGEIVCESGEAFASNSNCRRAVQTFINNTGLRNYKRVITPLPADADAPDYAAAGMPADVSDEGDKPPHRDFW